MSREIWRMSTELYPFTGWGSSVDRTRARIAPATASGLVSGSQWPASSSTTSYGPTT